MAKNEVAVAQAAGAVAAYDYGADSGAGFENQTSADRSIPFLAILQSNSPQVEDGGESSGDLLNTVTGEVFDGNEGVVFVPSMTEHVYVEWVPRTQGGGFVARYEADDPFVKQCEAKATQFGKAKTPDGNDIQETFYVYGAICPEGREPELAVMAFTSTKIKVYRKYFGNKLSMFRDANKKQPPLFAHSIRVSTFKDKNAKGTFYNFTLTPANGTVAESVLSPDDERCLAGKACLGLVKTGRATAAVDSQGGTAEADDNTTF